MVKAMVMLVVVIVVGLVYFAPFIIGKTRGVAHVDGLFAINLVFGWSIIGWVVAMAMALRSIEESVAPAVPVSTLLAPAPDWVHRNQRR